MQKEVPDITHGILEERREPMGGLGPTHTTQPKGLMDASTEMGIVLLFLPGAGSSTLIPAYSPLHSSTTLIWELLAFSCYMINLQDRFIRGREPREVASTSLLSIESLST